MFQNFMLGWLALIRENRIIPGKNEGSDNKKTEDDSTLFTTFSPYSLGDNVIVIKQQLLENLKLYKWDSE